MKSRMWKGCLVVLLSLISLVAGNSSLSAQTPEMSRAQKLERAIAVLWVEGNQAQAMKELAEVATGGTDALWAKALFHLACLDLMQGHRTEALARLAQLSKESANPEIAKYIEPLKMMLAPSPKEDQQLALDVTEKPIARIVQMAAQKAQRAVIIETGLSEKRISLSLPKTDFDKVIKILADLGDFETKMIGDIMLVSPSKKVPTSEESKDGTISLDFNDVDVRLALKLTAAKGKINLIMHKNVKGGVSIKLDKILPLDAIRMIARACDLYLEKDGDSYLVMNESDKDRLTGNSGEINVALQYLEAKEAQFLLRNESGVRVSLAEKGNSLYLYGKQSAIEKARDLLIAQDKPQKPLQISVNLWEPLKKGIFRQEEFLKLSDEQHREMARLVSSPKIITLPGKASSIKVEQSQGSPDKGGVEYNLSILPTSVGDGLIRLEIFSKLKVHSSKPNENTDQFKEWQTILVVKTNVPYACETQGGDTPMIMEILVSEAN